jgi:hypothetical protein
MMLPMMCMKQAVTDDNEEESLHLPCAGAYELLAAWQSRHLDSSAAEDICVWTCMMHDGCPDGTERFLDSLGMKEAMAQILLSDQPDRPFGT